MYKIIVFILFNLIIFSNANELELASPFVDNMVLQRQMKVPVWGWAEKGTKVKVVFDGQTQTAVADDKDKWLLYLEPLEASAIEREFVVSTEKKNITLKGVLVGEVWLASGQSNMDWLAGKSNCASLAGKISKSGAPIREYTTDIGSALYPVKRAQSSGGWKKSSEAGNFSAIALSFSWTLYQELGVPIGVLRSSHGATSIETWTPYEGFANHPKLENIAKQVRESNPFYPENKEALNKYFSELQKWQVESTELINRGGEPTPRPSRPGIYDEWRGPTRMFNKKINPLVPYALRGVIWNQGENNSSEGRLYTYKLEALINGLRLVWGKPDMPFYFTQMQCYGEEDVNNVGFADLREAQTLFLLNSKNTGMALQYDFNPENPGNIHNQNKLDGGSRLARWALAKDYGKEIAYCGPIYQSHLIDGNKVRVSFKQVGIGAGLMVGSKGLEKNSKSQTEPYVEPAVEVKAPLKHFRLAGEDGVWHAAEAVIDGNEVVVVSDKVAKPVGVQYAYCASPLGANLYNKAGLPAIPFAYFNGKQLLTEGNIVSEVVKKVETKPYILPATPFRDGLVLQRDAKVPVWGHAVAGVTITVSFAGQQKSTKVNEFERWGVELEPIAASSEGRELIIESSDGQKRVISAVVVGDVWVVAGDTPLTSGMRVNAKESLPDLKNVREFRQKCKARRFVSPRARQMEIGGGKYMASWEVADFDDPENYPSEFAYHFAKNLESKDIPIGIITLGANNPPITWVSRAALQDAPAFAKDRDIVNLDYPNTEAFKRALSEFKIAIEDYNKQISDYIQKGLDIPENLGMNAPALPESPRHEWDPRVETAAQTYNFCIHPLVPLAIKGFVWVPGEDNLPTERNAYFAQLELFQQNLAKTFGQKNVLFIYAKPASSLLGGVQQGDLANCKFVEFNSWFKSYKEIAEKLSLLAKDSKVE